MVSKSKKKRLKQEEELRIAQDVESSLIDSSQDFADASLYQLEQGLSDQEDDTPKVDASKVRLGHPSMKTKQQFLDSLQQVYNDISLEDEPIETHTVEDELKDHALRRILRKYIHDADSWEYTNMRNFLYGKDEFKKAEDIAFERIERIKSDRVKIRALLYNYGSLSQDITRLERGFIPLLQNRNELEKDKLYYESKYRQVQEELNKRNQKDYLTLIDLLKATLSQHSERDKNLSDFPSKNKKQQFDMDELLRTFKEMLGRIGPEQKNPTLPSSDVLKLLSIQHDLLDIRSHASFPSISGLDFAEILMTQYALKETLFKYIVQEKEFEIETLEAAAHESSENLKKVSEAMNMLEESVKAHDTSQKIMHEQLVQLEHKLQLSRNMRYNDGSNTKSSPVTEAPLSTDQESMNKEPSKPANAEGLHHISLTITPPNNTPHSGTNFKFSANDKMNSKPSSIPKSSRGSAKRSEEFESRIIAENNHYNISASNASANSNGRRQEPASHKSESVLTYTTQPSNMSNIFGESKEKPKSHKYNEKVASNGKISNEIDQDVISPSLSQSFGKEKATINKEIVKESNLDNHHPMHEDDQDYYLQSDNEAYDINGVEGTNFYEQSKAIIFQKGLESLNFPHDYSGPYYDFVRQFIGSFDDEEKFLKMSSEERCEKFLEYIARTPDEVIENLQAEAQSWAERPVFGPERPPGMSKKKAVTD